MPYRRRTLRTMRRMKHTDGRMYTLKYDAASKGEAERYKKHVGREWKRIHISSHIDGKGQTRYHVWVNGGVR